MSRKGTITRIERLRRRMECIRVPVAWRPPQLIEILTDDDPNASLLEGAVEYHPGSRLPQDIPPIRYILADLRNPGDLEHLKEV